MAVWYLWVLRRWDRVLDSLAGRESPFGQPLPLPVFTGVQTHTTFSGQVLLEFAQT